MKPTSKEVIDELCKILDATPKKIKGFMTPQDKADELIDKLTEKIYHLHQYPLCVEAAIQCALVAIDEIINAIDWHDEQYPVSEELFWLEVKQEIEKL